MRLYKYLILLLIAFGIYLRINIYIASNSFFTDEILLAKNIFERNYFELCFPLSHNQFAPIGFLWITKFFTKFGSSEYVFRLLPLVSSLISIPLFYLLIKENFKSKIASFLALFYFCINYQLLFYAQCFKQYSSDVLTAISMLILIFYANNKIFSTKKLLCMGLYTAASFLISFTSIFFWIPLFLSLAKNRLKNLFVFAQPLLILALFLTFNYQAHNSTFIQNYWSAGFNPLKIYELKVNTDFILSYMKFPSIYVILFILGIICNIKNSLKTTLFLLLPVLCNIVCAYMKIYPFERRLILFLLPIFIILALSPIEELLKFKNNLIKYLITSVLAVFLLINGIITLRSMENFFVKQDVKPALKTILEKCKKEDYVYLGYSAIPTYNYYLRLLPLPTENVILSPYLEGAKNKEELIETDIKNLKTKSNNNQIYLLFIKGNGEFEEEIKLYEKVLAKYYKINEKQDLRQTTLFIIK